ETSKTDTFKENEDADLDAKLDKRLDARDLAEQEYPEEINPAMWGLVPKHAVKNIEGFYKDYNTLNARSEKVFNCVNYRDSIRERRCLIIVDGFYSPRYINSLSCPYYCHLKDDSLFAFAGIYSEIDDGVYSCSILTVGDHGFTVKANNVRKRMPLLLESEFEYEWLRNDLSETNIKELMRVGFTYDQLEAYTVSRDLYKKGNAKDGPWAISKVDYPGLGGQRSFFD
ncbi:hypothetical protein LCGC14_1449430, partial [marine sediment metagenome]